MINNVDISDFVTWFVSQVVSIFSNMFSILDGIEFLGTSLLKVTITITILSIILPILLTLNKDVERVGAKIEKSRNSSKKD